MTNTYIFESDLTGMYEVTLNTNNVLSGTFNLNFTYGNLYTFLHNYNIDVVDENDKIKIINNSENNYYISLKQLDKIIEVILGPKSISETPIRLSASRLFGPEMPCKDSLRDFITLELGYVETDFEYLLLTNLFYLKNLDETPKQITITNLGETGEFFELMYPNNPTIQITPSTMSVCLSPNICDDSGGSVCDGATPTIKLGVLDSYGYYDFYINGELLDVARAFDPRGSFKTILEEYGVMLIPLDNNFQEVQLSGNNYPGAEIGYFINNGPRDITLKIETVDANAIQTDYPDSGNTSASFTRKGVEFCLSPSPS